MISKSKWVYGIMVVALSIGLLGLLTGCPENGVTPSLEDGTITIRVTGAGDHNGKHFFCAVFAPGADTTDPNNAAGVGSGDIIAGGTVETLMYDVATGTTPVTFKGGESYGAGGMIDVDDNDVPTSGVDYQTGKTVVVDGDMILEFVYPTDFTLVP